MEHEYDVIILTSQSGDWEGLYIDGELMDEGHTLGEGDSRLYLLKQAELHGFTSSDVQVKTLTDEDENYLMTIGSFPNDIDRLHDEY